MKTSEKFLSRKAPATTSLRSLFRASPLPFTMLLFFTPYSRSDASFAAVDNLFPHLPRKQGHAFGLLVRCFFKVYIALHWGSVRLSLSLSPFVYFDESLSIADIARLSSLSLRSTERIFCVAACQKLGFVSRHLIPTLSLNSPFSVIYFHRVFYPYQ